MSTLVYHLNMTTTEVFTQVERLEVPHVSNSA